MRGKDWREWTIADVTKVNALRGATSRGQAPMAKAEIPHRKYRNEPVWLGEERFDSRREADAWLQLVERERRGEITELRRQVPFDLCCPTPGDDAVVAQYLADFTWREHDGVFVVADAKGIRTPVFRLKAKWMALQHDITILLL